MMLQRIVVSALGVLSIALVLIGCQTVTGRSAGRYIDDQTISAEVKGKLVADRLANLTRVNVTTQNGVVYLTGNADTLDRAQRAADLARSVKGVHDVVNQIQVAATSPSVVSSTPSQSASPTVVTTAPPTATSPTVVTTTPPAATAPSAAGSVVAGTWHVGTVSRVDTAANMLYLTDGTVVQIQPTTRLTVNGQSIALSQVQPGAEVAVLMPAGTASTTTPSKISGGANALPRATAGTPGSGQIVIFNAPANR
jgi:hyperosmotically inducible protein